MIHRDDLIRMAREAGMTQLMGQTFPGHAMTPDVLERLVSIVAAHIIARQPPQPMVLNVSDADLAELKAWLVNAPNMPLVPAPPDTALERERAARVAAQSELADLKERLARSGVEQRRAVLAERAECLFEAEAFAHQSREARLIAESIRARGAA